MNDLNVQSQSFGRSDFHEYAEVLGRSTSEIALVLAGVFEGPRSLVVIGEEPFDEESYYLAVVERDKEGLLHVVVAPALPIPGIAAWYTDLCERFLMETLPPAA